MTITDSHFHLFDLEQFSYPWLETVPELNHPFLSEDLEFEAAGVDRAVFVQADCLAEQGLAEARYVSGLAQTHPQIVGIVAYAPVGEPADNTGSTEPATASLTALDAYLDEAAKIDRVVGFRRVLQGQPDEFFARPELAEGFRMIAARGYVSDAVINHRQLPLLIALSEAVPEASIVLDHLGKPPIASGDPAARAAWERNLRRLAENPNVSVKLSGLMPESDPSKPLRVQVGPYLETAYEIFGADRCMLGSDSPVSNVGPNALGYAETFELMLRVLAGTGVDAASLAAVSSTTAGRVYGLPA